MTFNTLISTETLASRLDDQALVIVDCRFRLDDVAWGKREYEAGHVAGAGYADLDRDLSGRKTGTNGRHPLPDPSALIEQFGALGVTEGVQVVAYDQGNGMFASRLWWLLRWLGHDRVAVLDGGFAKWVSEGRPTSSGIEHRPARPFSGSVRAEMTVGMADVAARIGAPDWRLVDARAPERFRGETEPLDRVAGHIPSAANHFFQRNLDEHGAFLGPEELRRQFQDTLGPVPADRAICYCGSGVTACHNLLALEIAGMSGAKLYPGSWSEWCGDPGRPVER